MKYDFFGQNKDSKTFKSKKFKDIIFLRGEKFSRENASSSMVREELGLYYKNTSKLSEERIAKIRLLVEGSELFIKANYLYNIWE